MSEKYYHVIDFKTVSNLLYLLEIRVETDTIGGQNGVLQKNFKSGSYLHLIVHFSQLFHSKVKMPLPTVIVPGYLESAIAYRQIEQSLQQLGFPTVTVPLRRRDWIPTLGGRPVTPILQQLDRTVNQILLQYNATQINLIGHSAGGWISRIYIGEKPYLARGDVKPSLWEAHP